MTDRQLAAARLLVRGRGSVEIASHLGVNRHTVAVWKRNPSFVAELQRLRGLLTATAVSPAPPFQSAPTQPAPIPTRLPAPIPVRMTRAQAEREDRECEAMIEQILRARAAGRGR